MTKPTHGGKRKGAGRKTTIGATERITITLTPDDMAQLDAIADNRSKAIRTLIHSHRKAQRDTKADAASLE